MEDGWIHNVLSLVPEAIKVGKLFPFTGNYPKSKLLFNPINNGVSRGRSNNLRGELGSVKKVNFLYVYNNKRWFG